MRCLALALVLATSLLAAGCGDSSAGGPAGTYDLDAKLMKPEIEKMMATMFDASMQMLDMLPPEQKAEAMKKIEEQKAGMMDEFNFVLTMNGDGSYAVTQGDKTKAKGTWTASGSVISITTTEENGKPKADPETLNGTYENGMLRFKPDKDMPFDLIFRKR
jgi:hypothetical protein